MQLSSKNNFSGKKAQTHENLSFCIAKKQFISLERNIFSCSWALLLKLHISYFFSTEKEAFEHLVASSFSLICTKHRICVLRSSKEVIFVQLSSKNRLFLQKAQHGEICSSALQKTVHFIRKKHCSCSLSFALKIAFSYFFSTEKEALSILWPRILIICLVALNT